MQQYAIKFQAIVNCTLQLCRADCFKRLSPKKLKKEFLCHHSQWSVSSMH